jgi:hypothetical protein
MTVRITGSTMDDFIENVNALQNEVLKDTNTLTVTPEGSTSSVYFNILKSPPFTMPLTNRTERRLRGDAVFTLNAEPYAYGDEITICGFNLISERVHTGTELPLHWGYTGALATQDENDYWFFIDGGKGDTNELYYPNSVIPTVTIPVTAGVYYGLSCVLLIEDMDPLDGFVKIFIDWYNVSGGLVASSTMQTFTESCREFGYAGRELAPTGAVNAAVRVQVDDVTDGAVISFTDIDMGTGIFPGLSTEYLNGPISIDLGTILGNVVPTLDVEVGTRKHDDIRSLVMFPTTGDLEDFMFEAETVIEEGVTSVGMIEGNSINASRLTADDKSIAVHDTPASWGILEFSGLDVGRIYNVYAMHYVDANSAVSFLSPTKFAVSSARPGYIYTAEDYIKRKVRAFINQQNVLMVGMTPSLLDEYYWSNYLYAQVGGAGDQGGVNGFHVTFTSSPYTLTGGPIDVPWPGGMMVVSGATACSGTTTIVGTDFMGVAATETLTFDNTTKVYGRQAFKTVTSFAFSAGMDAEHVRIGMDNSLGYGEFVLQPVGTVQVGTDGAVWLASYQSSADYDIFIDYVLFAPYEYGILTFYSKLQEDNLNQGLPDATPDYNNFIGPDIIKLEGNKVTQKKYVLGGTDTGGENYEGIYGGIIKAPLGTLGKLIIAHSCQSMWPDNSSLYMPIEVEIKYTPRWIHWR